MAKKEIFVDIKNGIIGGSLGDGWPPGKEAVDELDKLLDGMAVMTKKGHQKHRHRDETNKSHNRN